MPRKEGSQSTRRTYKVEDLLIASFAMGHEEWLWRRPCAISGCDHRMGPKTDEPGWTDWRSCDEDNLPAQAVFKSNIDQPAGMVCPCHVGKILAQQD